MKKTLLVGFVCVSLGAFAQSSADQGQTPNTKTPEAKTVVAPRDAASGQASGKRMHKPLTIQPDASASDQATGKPAGKTAVDDWSAPAAAKTNVSNNGQPSKRVAAADVNGDGKADLSSGSATVKPAPATSSSGVQSPRDVASGQASGKRQHQPVTIRKEVDAPSPKSK